MTIGVLKENNNETRVSLLPEHIKILKLWSVDIFIESGAGKLSFASDDQYKNNGAVIADRSEVITKSDILLSINLPEISNNIDSGKILLGFYQPLNYFESINTFVSAGLTIFSIDMIPRTTRAQPMDVLSSQANIAGYKAVLYAANLFPRYFPMFMTAAGSIPPAKVLILGAGVAGLQAIATARRLGAVVEVFDTRPAVKEEVMSLGAKFIEVEGAADTTNSGGYGVEQSSEFLLKQKSRIAESAMKADIIISTAQIPGKKAPILITSEMIDSMKPGSVIIDLAAASGGNTDLTENNKTIARNYVSIVGNSFLAGTMPMDASRLYGKNIINFLRLIIDPNGKLVLNFEDDLVKGTCISHDGILTHERLKSLVSKTSLV